MCPSANRGDAKADSRCEYDSPDLNVFLLWVFLYICATLTAFMHYGRPASTWTWVGPCIGLAFLAPLVFVRRSWLRALSVCVAFALCSLLAGPFMVDSLIDIHGGRRGYAVYPSHYRYGHDGEHTALLESYLGPLDPEWRYHFVVAIRFARWHAQSDRGNSRNIIFREQLPAILDMLPSHEARMLVLRSVTDPDNLMRIHQGLLLTVAEKAGFPPGYGAESWWQAHRWVFLPEYDTRATMRNVWGWHYRIESSFRQELSEDDWREVRCQLDATELSHLKTIEWDLDDAWGDLMREIGDGGISPTSPELGVNRVVWWPAETSWPPSPLPMSSGSP